MRQGSWDCVREPEASLIQFRRERKTRRKEKVLSPIWATLLGLGGLREPVLLRGIPSMVPRPLPSVQIHLPSRTGLSLLASRFSKERELPFHFLTDPHFKTLLEKQVETEGALQNSMPSTLSSGRTMAST